MSLGILDASWGLLNLRPFLGHLWGILGDSVGTFWSVLGKPWEVLAVRPAGWWGPSGFDVAPPGLGPSETPSLPRRSLQEASHIERKVFIWQVDRTQALSRAFAERWQTHSEIATRRAFRESSKTFKSISVHFWGGTVPSRTFYLYLT